MKHKYKLTITIESDRALKAVEQYLIEEHRVSAFVDTKRKSQHMPYISVTDIDLKKAKDEVK